MPAKKNKVTHKIFHSKALLFGEHIINKGAQGLAVPFDHFDGVLKFDKSSTDKAIKQSNESLGKLAHYIIEHEKLHALYDTNQLLEDIEQGLYFDSNIPQGYGLGSSGALVAAIYHEYRKNRKKNFVLSELKRELATVESYFHGTSSGLDPIVCYLHKTVLINNGEVSEAFDLPKSEKQYLKIFLINTHIARKTSPFVNLFLEKCKDKKFMDVVQRSVIPANNIAIDALLRKKYAALMKSVKLISQLQMDMQPEFIPTKFKEAWEQGLKYNDYHLKICGAGGGGFIIGFAKADADLPILLRGMDVVPLMNI